MPSQFDGTRIAMGSREGSEPAVASDEWRLPQQTPTTNKRGRPLRVGGGPSCSESNSSEAPVRQQLRKAFFRGTDPFDAALLDRVDHMYPQSSLRASFVKSVFDVLPSPPRFWLEIGSFVGSSVITTVVAAHLCAKPHGRFGRSVCRRQGHVELPASDPRRLAPAVRLQLPRARYGGQAHHT